MINIRNIERETNVSNICASLEWRYFDEVSRKRQRIYMQVFDLDDFQLPYDSTMIKEFIKSNAEALDFIVQNKIIFDKWENLKSFIENFR